MSESLMKPSSRQFVEMLCQKMNLTINYGSGGTPVWLAEKKKPGSDFGGAEVSPLFPSLDDLEAYAKDIITMQESIDNSLSKIYSKS